MPIQIKIKSSGADISEYDSPTTDKQNEEQTKKEDETIDSENDNKDNEKPVEIKETSEKRWLSKIMPLINLFILWNL